MNASPRRDMRARSAGSATRQTIAAGTHAADARWLGPRNSSRTQSGDVVNINLTRQILVESLAEFAGFKTGILLTAVELRRHLPAFSQLLDGEPSQPLRIRPDTYDEVSHALLVALGAV